MELKNWGRLPPKDGIFINLYKHESDEVVFCRAVRKGFFIGVEECSTTTPDSLDMWCEVPAPPDWKRNNQRMRAELLAKAVVVNITRLNELETAQRNLAEEMVQTDAEEKKDV